MVRRENGSPYAYDLIQRISCCNFYIASSSHAKPLPCILGVLGTCLYVSSSLLIRPSSRSVWRRAERSYASLIDVSHPILFILRMEDCWRYIRSRTRTFLQINL